METLHTLYLALLVTGFLLLVAYLLIGADDVFWDLYYWLTSARRWWRARRYPRLSLDWLEAREQQAIAILIPAWREASVIAKTLRQLCQTVRYRNYEVFVGTYPNDPATQREVDLVAADFPQVHKVVGPDPGPTTKAHNLNTLVRALREHEGRTGKRFEVIVIHDAEDVVHPLSLLLFNYLIPRLDMVQLPVFPAPVSLWNFTHWTYADEFAERHTKELLARERAKGFVPSAGVGTGFSRRALDLLALRGKGEVFSTESFTEDYLIGLRLRLEGFKTAFVTQSLPLWHPQEKHPRLWRWIATQALFPRSLPQAIRQKARWILGIALQSWAALGWPGPWSVRWNLLHDRKVLLSAFLGFLGYGWVAWALYYEGLRRDQASALPPLAAPGSPLWGLILGATGLLLWRLFHRGLAVGRIYGLWPALTSVPRAFYANVVNFLAVYLALKQFLRYKRRGQLVWDKTAHEFPEAWIGTSQGLLEKAAKVEPPALLALEDEAEVASLESDLRSSDPKVRQGALRRIPRGLGERLLPVVGERLKDEEWRVRAEACRVLGFFRLPKAASWLEEAAHDPSYVVRANAIKALTKLGVAGEAALLRLLCGSDRYAREAALASLEQGGFLEKNLSRLRSAAPEERARAQAFFKTLERCGPSQLARELLAREGIEGVRVLETPQDQD
jgi:adsorption protein B